MRNVKRWIAVALAVAVGTIGLEIAEPAVAGATQVELTCAGITGDNASPLGDSQKVLGLLATFTGGGSGLTFASEITTDAPAKVTPGSGPFTANFDLSLALPASLVAAAKNILGLSAVEVRDATYAIQASGAADANFTTVVPSQVIDLNAANVVVNQRVTGSLEPKTAGTISYRPGANTRLTIVINKNVAGIQINSITVTCGANKDIGNTAVQIPGSPNAVQPIYQVAWAGTVVGRPLIGADVTPDAGNPISPESLRVTGYPEQGYTAVGGGAAFYLAPLTPGLYTAPYEVCAASKTVPEVPGANTVQTLTWPENYAGKGLNAHPLGMALSFKGQKTPVLPLSFLLGQPTPTQEPQLDFFQRFFSEFKAPAAAQIQAALEGLSTIGKGNVQVTAAAGGGYTITFVGALGLSEQPKIEVVDFTSWLPADGLTAVLAALRPPAPDPTAPPTTTAAPETPESLDAKLAAGQITFQQWLDGRLALLKDDLIKGATTPEAITALTSLFPKPPETAVTAPGKPTIPQTETGPLCTQFKIGYFVIPNPNARVLGTSVTRYKTVTKCSYKRVKVKGSYVKKRVCTKVRVRA